MPRPALTRSRIVSAGVGIVRELGFAGLDARAVARRVNATATGVQRHISATELVESVAAEVVRSMPPVPARGDWARRLRQWAVHTRAWLTEYPGLARHLLVNRWETPVALDRLEAVVGVLGHAELTETQRVMAGTALYWFVLSRTDLDESATIIGGDAAAQVIAGTAGRWPQLSSHVIVHSAATLQAQFLFELDLLIAGIARRSPERVRRPNSDPGGSSAGRRRPTRLGT